MSARADGASGRGPVRRRAEVALSRRGLADSPVVGAILRERVARLSSDPTRESVLLLAHGMADDSENADVMRAVEAALDSIRTLGAFRAVRGETLREDWPAARQAAEQRIRQFVQQGMANGDVIVVPFRLSGFGPYARVLAGLMYRADSTGLLPHEHVGRWMRETVDETACAARWGSCGGLRR